MEGKKKKRDLVAIEALGFPQVLKSLRVRSGMSQRAVVKRVKEEYPRHSTGFSVPALSHWEGGSRLPRIGQLGILGDVLGLTMPQILRMLKLGARVSSRSARVYEHCCSHLLGLPEEEREASWVSLRALWPSERRGLL